MSQRILFYDFETNGLPDHNAPLEAVQQPHIVQVAAVLLQAETLTPISSVNLIARPEGWAIPDHVARLHGITTAHAQNVGVPESIVVGTLHAMGQMADLRAGHNEKFDAQIMLIGLKRFGYGHVDAGRWSEAPTFCTQEKSTEHCKLPPTEAMMMAGRHNFKSPKLTEAYQHFTGKPMQKAHSALADVRACITVYAHLTNHPSVQAPKEAVTA